MMRYKMANKTFKILNSGINNNNFTTPKIKAFTLAEVLITLAIIGVVAALTIPTLIQKYKKHEVISKLKKISSEISQAYQLGLLNESYIGSNPTGGFKGDDPDLAEEMFKRFYPNLKTLKIEKGEKGVFAYLTDGIVLYFRKTTVCSNKSTEAWGGCAYFFACLNNKACDKIKENESYANLFRIVGKDIFVFYTDGSLPTYSIKNYDRDTLLDYCKKNESIEACSSLIYLDGWEIKDDYPFKF